MHFKDLDLIEPLQRALAHEGYTAPTPIQEQTIPKLLAGKDLLGIAQTGTGKTAAFTLPILQHLTKHKRIAPRASPRVLILAPTRELAAQIGQSIAAYGRHTTITFTVIYGGVGQGPQVNALNRGVDILVATPGRLLDLIEQRHVHLGHVEIFVLDEADRMLDMGFIRDIKRITPLLPKERQTLLFSATMPGEISSLANGILHYPERVEVTPQATTVERIEQKVLFVDKDKKEQLLLDLLAQRHLERVLVFTRTKHLANKVSLRLTRAGIKADAIHGNKSQNARTQALTNFKSGRVLVLVATDIAARGIDIDDISHVINYELPNEAESYVHRIGRTARAGAEGTAYSFCAADERDLLRSIERLTRTHIPVMEHPYHSSSAQHAVGEAARQPPRQQYGQRRAGPSRAPRNAERSGERSSEHKPRYGAGGPKRRGRVRRSNFHARR